MMFDFRKLVKRKPKLLILVNLIQDLDILLPLAVAFNSHSEIDLEVVVIDHFGKQSPRIEYLLRQAGIKPRFLRQSAVMAGRQPAMLGVKAVITASESNHAAHKTAYELTMRANQKQIKTYTLQHGFENIGLTYSDEATPITSVSFASQSIFIWGHLDTLYSHIPVSTREKCISVGCPKYTSPPGPKVSFSHSRKQLITIFENLHWERYNDTYRSCFIADMHQVAHQFPHITFLIKPHHAGQWLTGKKDSKLPRYQGELPQADNLVIADPTDPKWENFTAPALLEVADAAITTPSTVALDAARLGRPVAVVGYDLALEKYHPLPILRKSHDWADWVNQLTFTEGYHQLQQTGHRFLQKQTLSGDATARIVTYVMQQML
jgi:hypothetical protein